MRGEFDYWLVNTGEEDEPDINGAIKPKEFGSMVSDVINVDSYDEFAKKIEMSGGKMITKKNDHSIYGLHWILSRIPKEIYWE